jgi:ribosomal protein S18 acetylase RimI-like enzyme
MAAVAIQPINVKLAAVAEQVQSLHLAAYSQETTLAGVQSLPPMERSTFQIQVLSELFFGAFVRGALAGAISESEGEGSVEVCSLAVHPAFQRQGVGRALLQHLLARAAGRPMQVSTAAANLPAIALYQAAGFVVVRQSVVPSLQLPLVHLQRLGSNPSVKGTGLRPAPYVER